MAEKEVKIQTSAVEEREKFLVKATVNSVLKEVSFWLALPEDFRSKYAAPEDFVAQELASKLNRSITDDDLEIAKACLPAFEAEDFIRKVKAFLEAAGLFALPKPKEKVSPLLSMLSMLDELTPPDREQLLKKIKEKKLEEIYNKYQKLLELTQTSSNLDSAQKFLSGLRNKSDKKDFACALWAFKEKEPELFVKIIESYQREREEQKSKEYKIILEEIIKKPVGSLTLEEKQRIGAITRLVLQEKKFPELSGLVGEYIDKHGH
ncbi:MAG: hypothetical protein AB1393_07745 [Candidatus Edwardsbacteria bacterium]